MADTRNWKEKETVAEKSRSYTQDSENSSEWVISLSHQVERGANNILPVYEWNKYPKKTTDFMLCPLLRNRCVLNNIIIYNERLLEAQ